jgi:hypothetical protein
VVLTRDADGHVHVDDAGTSAAREAIRQQRKERARPARDVYQEERERILTRDYPLEALHEMYRDAATYERWHENFYSFWQLPEDFEL